MKCKSIAVASLLLLASFSFFSVADTVHEVQRGETLFGIAYKYKVSVDDLQQWNPEVKNGVKKGMKLVIKDGKTSDAEKTDVKEALPKNDKATGDVSANSDSSINTKTGGSRRKKAWAKDVDRNAEASSEAYLPEAEFARHDDADTILAVEDVLPVYEAEGNNILVLLPFTAESESPTRQAQYNADFYRGLLLAAKNMTERDGRQIEILALDTNNDLAKLETQLNNTSNRDIAVIIAPEDEAQYAKIVEYASPRGIYVINPFIFKDLEQYESNPYVIRANISQAEMISKAVNELLLDYAGFTPVILNPIGAKAEKEPFVNALKARCESLGIECETINFEGNLDDAALASLDPDKDYVFVPKSGALTIFNKFAPALGRLKSKNDRHGKIALFGYPDWTTFRGESVVLLHHLQATIYSRFFYNESDPLTSSFQDEFIDWYGAPTLEVLPNQGVLGYDTGAFLIELMQKAPLGRSLSDYEHRGVQSSFSFNDEEEGRSPSNGALYIITFMPDNTTRVEII